MIAQTQIPTQIAPESTEKTTCARCTAFKDTGEGRGRGWCLLFNRVAFTHHKQATDCKLNLATEARAKNKTIDLVGQQIKETRSLLDKSKRRCFIKNQLILKANF